MAEVLDGVDWQGKVFSNGWVVPQGGELKSVEPATGEVLGRVGLANAADIDAAAAAARLARHSSGSSKTAVSSALCAVAMASPAAPAAASSETDRAGVNRQ